MQEKINELNALLPTIPFVQEQIGFGIKYAKESGVEEGRLLQAFEMAIKLAKLANEYSDPNFYAYRPILCALLSVVEDESKLDMFRTETNSVLTILEQFNEFVKTYNESAKQAAIYLAKAIMGDKKDLCLAIMTFLTEEIKTGNVLKVAYISVDLRLNGFEMTGALYHAYNRMLIELNKVNY